MLSALCPERLGNASHVDWCPRRERFVLRSRRVCSWNAQLRDTVGHAELRLSCLYVVVFGVSCAAASARMLCETPVSSWSEELSRLVLRMLVSCFQLPVLEPLAGNWAALKVRGLAAPSLL